jgi:hypothetical protein
MKNAIFAIAVAAVTLLGTAPQAEAHSHGKSSYIYVSGYRSCSTPIYKQKYFIGYDRCGREMWGYRIVSAPRHIPAPRPRYTPTRGHGYPYYGYPSQGGSCR